MKMFEKCEKCLINLKKMTNWVKSKDFHSCEIPII